MAKTNKNTTNPQQVPPIPQASHTLSTIKLPILKKGEYDIWAMEMEHYLEHTDYPIWEVIQNRNGVSTEDANQKFLSTNEVNTAFGVSTSSGHNSQKEGSSSYTDDLMYFFFANQSSGLQLDHEDLEQTGRKLHFDAKELVDFDKSKVKCFNCHNTEHFARECISKGNQDSRRRDAGNTGYKARNNGKRPTKQDEIKLWSLLMEKVLIRLVILKMTQRTML
nr:ribonuclease H-like domain-containing protein [Tanacetum cinerariifolium]